MSMFFSTALVVRTSSLPPSPPPPPYPSKGLGLRVKVQCQNRKTLNPKLGRLILGRSLPNSRATMFLSVPYIKISLNDSLRVT